MNLKDDSQKGDIATDEEIEVTAEETSPEEKDTPIKKKLPIVTEGSEDDDDAPLNLAEEDDDSDDEDGDTSAYGECDKSGCKEEIY